MLDSVSGQDVNVPRHGVEMKKLPLSHPEQCVVVIKHEHVVVAKSARFDVVKELLLAQHPLRSRVKLEQIALGKAPQESFAVEGKTGDRRRVGLGLLLGVGHK